MMHGQKNIKSTSCTKSLTQHNLRSYNYILFTKRILIMQINRVKKNNISSYEIKRMCNKAVWNISAWWVMYV